MVLSTTFDTANRRRDQHRPQSHLSGGSAMSLRDNKKTRTRAALRAAAFHLFRTKGFDRTTVDEIAAEAGVSRTTFFRYFPTKEAVVFDRGREVGEVFRRWISERPRHENPLE